MNVIANVGPVAISADAEVRCTAGCSRTNRPCAGGPADPLWGPNSSSV
jgi:hypothetical protein